MWRFLSQWLSRTKGSYVTRYYKKPWCVSFQIRITVLYLNYGALWLFSFGLSVYYSRKRIFHFYLFTVWTLFQYKFAIVANNRVTRYLEHKHVVNLGELSHAHITGFTFSLPFVWFSLLSFACKKTSLQGRVQCLG